MSRYAILMAAVIGQMTADGPRTGPVLSEAAKKAQARALAGLRANEPTIERRLTEYYRLENQRLRDRIRTVGAATDRAWSLTGGQMRYERFDEGTGGNGGFASVPPGSGAIPAGNRDQPPLG